MGYKQNNPLPMMKSAMKMMKAEKKSGMHRDSAMYMNSPMYKGHSPMEMGHSPMEMGHDSPAKNMNKGYGQEVKSPMKRESAELKDMPIVDIEKGDAEGDGRKDARKEQPKTKRKYGSPAKAAKPDYIDIDGDGNKEESMKEAAKDKKGSPANMIKGSKDEKSSEKVNPNFKPKKRTSTRRGSPAKKYDRVVLGGNKGDKSKTKPGKKDYEKKGSPAKISEKAAERKAKKGKGFISQKTGGKDTEKSFTKLTRKGRKEMKETGMVSNKEMKKTKKIK